MTHQSPHAVQPDLFPELLPDEDEIAFDCWTDGLVAGVVVGPKGVAMSEWMSLVWDAIDEEPAKQELRAPLETALSELWSEVADAMRDDALYYLPRFLELDDDLVGAKIWADGFQAAVSLRPAAWTQLAGDPEHCGPLLSIMLLALDDAELLDVIGQRVPGKPLDLTRLRQDQADKVVESVHNIHRYFHGRHSPPARAVGRNARCPCGSGRKYKKCCLR